MTNSPSPASPPNLSEGQKLAGCYILRARLSGAEGALIWRAQDEVLGKDVSLHFLPPAILLDKIAMNALRQEVKRTRALIHPNILRVYDLVEEAGWAAVSMDTFEGRSLDAILREKGTLEAGEVQSWVGPLCQTLEEAHKINLVHRDLAPENVFIGGARGFFLANFGISRVVQDALNRVEKKGSENPRLSTLSPQLLDAQTPTRSDDVYGVGALLFQVLAGQPVFSKGDVIQQIRSAVPPRVSEVRSALQKTASRLPDGWDDVIAAALLKAPEARPQTPAQVAAKLAVTGPAPAALKPAATALVTELPKPGEPTPKSAPVAAPEPPKKKPAEILAERAAQFKGGDVSKPAEPVTPTAPADDTARGNTKKKAADLLAERAAQFKAEGGKAPAPNVSDKAGKSADKKTEKPKSTAASGGSDLFLPPRQSRSPIGLVAVMALLVVGGAAYYYHRQTEGQASLPPQIAMTDGGEGTELTAAKNSLSEPSLSPTPADASSSADAPAAVPSNVTSDAPRIDMPSEFPLPESAPVAARVAADAPALTLVQNSAARRPAPPTPPTAAPPPAATSPAAVAAGPMDDRELAEKNAALEKLAQEAAAAERAHEEKLKQQQAAEAAVAEAQKTMAEKTKAAAPARKAVEDLLNSRKKKEEEQKTAEAAAQAAQQLAAEKARAAEDAKKALADFDTQNKEKLAAQQQAESELQAMQQTLAERQKAAADAAKSVADAEAAARRQAAMVKEREQEVAAARMAAEKAAAESEKKRLAMEAEKRRLDDEITAMRTMFEQKMKDIEERRRQLETGAAPSAPVGPSRTERVPSPPSADARPVAAPLTLAMKTEPDSAAAPPPSLEARPGEIENSLGLKFVPVGDVFFSIWQTRVKDFEVFAKAANLKSSNWKAPGFRQAPDHPVVNVTWNEAVAFCKWLTEKERKEGKLPPNQIFRLPTDLEWSAAVGLEQETGRTPEARDMGVQDVYPWGTTWPPPEGAGNYTGEETGSDVAIKGYNDKFAWTAPVGSFPPNKFGLYDMGGNVWQWCMDSWNTESKAKVLRGASWYNGALKLSLLASCRVHAAPDSSTDNYGFRIVRAPESGTRAAKRP